MRERALADEWLQTATGAFVPEKYVWRANELCGPRRRAILATTLRRLERASQDRLTPRRRVLHLTAVREHRPLLRALARRLDDASRPVTPAGVLRATELITSPSSPLYGFVKDRPLDTEIETILTLLGSE